MLLSISALGRIGKASLKQKVRHRAQLVTNSLPQKLPEIATILDTAVDCRNHRVHGSPMKLPSQSLDSIMYLLTDTLEFIFGASDLVESGWEIKEWDSRTSTSHPFGRYLKTYIGILAGGHGPMGQIIQRLIQRRAPRTTVLQRRDRGRLITPLKSACRQQSKRSRFT